LRPTSTRLGALLGQLRPTLGLEGLPGHLLHHVTALLPGHGDTLPASSVRTFLLVHVLCHRGKSVLTDILSLVAANLARCGHSITNLFSDWFADLVGDSRTLLFSHLLGLNPGHYCTDTETSRTAVLDWDLGTLLPVEHLAVHLGHLATLQLRGISTFLSGEGATLAGG